MKIQTTLQFSAYGKWTMDLFLNKIRLKFGKWWTRTTLLFSLKTAWSSWFENGPFQVSQPLYLAQDWITIHRMQIWRTARLSPGTGRMQARLVRLWCFVLTEKSCFAVDLVCFCSALPISCCVPECHQKELKSSTAEKVFFFFVSAVASQGKQTKKSSSRSPRELLKFVRSGWRS